MTTNSDRIERWAKRILDPSLRELAPRGSVFSQGDTIYSYGTHFPIAKVLRDKRGKARTVLLNGDRYSATTSAHQSAVRWDVDKHAPDVPRVTIPFTALRAAGIDMDSIVLLDGRDAGWTYTRHVGELPKSARIVGEGEYGTVYRGREYVGLRVAGSLVMDMEGHPGVQLVEREGDQYVWHVGRHWLGESLIAARRRGSTKRTKYMSGFDRNESRRLYFFCELPPTGATTIDGALEALKPDTVRMAEAMGRVCERQGDIFGVPMPGLTLAELKRRGGTFARRSDARRGELAAARAERIFRNLTDAIDIRFNTTDYIEYRKLMSRQSFGQLPWEARRLRELDGGGWARTNYQRKHAEYVRSVVAHRRDKWRSVLNDMVQREHERSTDSHAVSLLGTAHTATHVVTMPDGSQFARGVMYHDPRLLGENRVRDHASRKLGDGKTWYMIQRNTVPVAKGSRQRIAA